MPENLRELMTIAHRPKPEQAYTADGTHQRKTNASLVELPNVGISRRERAARSGRLHPPRPRAAFLYRRTGEALALCRPIAACSQDAVLGRTKEAGVGVLGAHAKSFLW